MSNMSQTSGVTYVFAYLVADMLWWRTVASHSAMAGSAYTDRYWRRSRLKWVGESPSVALSSVSLGNNGLIHNLPNQPTLVLWINSFLFF